MAIVEKENILGFVDKRRTVAQTSLPTGTAANYADVNALRTRLAAIDGTYFSTARLNQMTKNDMVYALRRADDAAGI